MIWTLRKKIALSILTLLLIAFAAAYQAAQRFLFDRYAGQPQVVGLPAGYDPMASTDPYAGPHPSDLGRPRDPYSYPIPLGESGPAAPTYTDDLEYPHACRSEPGGLGQPLPDNQEGAGIEVYAVDDAGNKTGRIIGYSKDCSLRTRVYYYYYRSRDSGNFLPHTGEPSDIEELSIGGQAVPFVVRIEIGTINRHIYVIVLLKGPNDTPDEPDLKFWNRKLIYQFRGGSGIGRRMARRSR